MNRNRDNIYIALFCAFLIGLIVWAVDPEAPNESLQPNPENSYYNLLVQGFRSGHLYMNLQPADGFAKLSDPYDPRLNSAFMDPIRDTSYYQGKFYLYFGVTPAVVLFWPASMIGLSISDRLAVAIFFAIGFFMLWQLVRDIQYRYFPKIGFTAIAPGIFMLGLAIGLTRSGTVYNVPTVSAFMFAMLALVAIWHALHEPSRRTVCLLIASLAYGLAVGARPSLLFGAGILLVPIAMAWQTSRAKTTMLLFSTVGPIILIGLGLLAYNDLRFGSPFEFGRHYQVTGDYESPTAHQFGLHYLWFNLRYYFLTPFKVGGYFPFLEDAPLPIAPSGYSEYSQFGCIFVIYPFLALVFALPFIWRNHPIRSALDWFVLALLFLFSTCAITDCLFLSANMRYALDFLPPLILLAFIVFLSQRQMPVILAGWYVLLGFSLVFNTFSNIKMRAYSSFTAGNTLLIDNQPEDALGYLQDAVYFEPHSAQFHTQLGADYFESSQLENAMNEFQIAIAIDSSLVDARSDLGCIQFVEGQTNEAYVNFEKVLAADPMQTNWNNGDKNVKIAVLLVSDADPAKRNPALALKLAAAACRETNDKLVTVLLSASMVYASAGQWDNAVATVQKGIALAMQNGQSNLLQQGQLLLADYLKHQRQ